MASDRLSAPPAKPRRRALVVLLLVMSLGLPATIALPVEAQLCGQPSFAMSPPALNFRTPTLVTPTVNYRLPSVRLSTLPALGPSFPTLNLRSPTLPALPGASFTMSPSSMNLPAPPGLSTLNQLAGLPGQLANQLSSQLNRLTNLPPLPTMVLRCSGLCCR